MPATRSERAAGGSGILQAPETFLTVSQSTAGSLSAVVQSDMSDPVDLKDSLIHRLRTKLELLRQPRVMRTLKRK